MATGSRSFLPIFKYMVSSPKQKSKCGSQRPMNRGLANMFGVYQTYYQSNILSHQTASQISWVGSLQGALLFFGSVVAGPFFDLGYLRTLLMMGTFFVVFGLMMTSISNAYWQILLAQGVTVGLGFGCLFLPSVAIVSQYFTSRKAFASGVASTGSSIGYFPLRLYSFRH